MEENKKNVATSEKMTKLQMILADKENEKIILTVLAFFVFFPIGLYLYFNYSTSEFVTLAVVIVYYLVGSLFDSYCISLRKRMEE